MMIDEIYNSTLLQYFASVVCTGQGLFRLCSGCLRISIGGSELFSWLKSYFATSKHVLPLCDGWRFLQSISALETPYLLILFPGKRVPVECCEGQFRASLWRYERASDKGGRHLILFPVRYAFYFCEMRGDYLNAYLCYTRTCSGLDSWWTS